MNRAAHRIACCVLGTGILAYAGLIGLGRWSLDEYYYQYFIRHHLQTFIDRLRWSPRPLSEIVYYGYVSLVGALHNPFISPFLAVLWAVFLLAGLVTSLQNQREGKPVEARVHLLLALALMALFLAGGHTTEVFYWPGGAVAYLPTLAVTLLFFLQTVDGRLDTSRGRTLAGVCLFIAAAASEVGATFALCYAALRVAEWLWLSIRKRGNAAVRPFWWWLIPALVSLAVFATVRIYRFQRNLTVHELDQAGKSGLDSLAASLQEWVIEIIGREMLAAAFRAHPDPHTWLHSGSQLLIQMFLGSRIWMEVLLAAGMALCWSRFGGIAKPLAARILQVVAALQLASLATTAAANLTFGGTCCGRQEVMRECWTIMSIAGLAIAACAWLPDWSRYASFAPIVLVAAFLSLGHFDALARTYRIYGTLYTTNLQNYASGYNAGDQPVLFRLRPFAGIIVDEQLAPGTYTALPPAQLVRLKFGLSAYPYYILGFFEKRELIIMPADGLNASFQTQLVVKSLENNSSSRDGKTLWLTKPNAVHFHEALGRATLVASPLHGAQTRLKPRLPVKKSFHS
jgi:hypothetical protein